MFWGREQELAKLNQIYDSSRFEMVVLYGRRRVGKTSLIKEFCRNRKTVFFSAQETNLLNNLAALSAAIFAGLMPESRIAPEFRSFQEALLYLADMTRKERVILVVDEYPYLAASDSSISSQLQNLIDHHLKETQLLLILCGSSMSFMEEQVMGYASPLYGRRTAQFKILPFDYLESAHWVPEYNPEEKAIVYGITGGIPQYLNEFANKLPLRTNILQNLFDMNAILFEEPSNLLKQELREPQTYNAIITAIANGSSKLSEIATKVQIESGLCTRYLHNLMSLGIIRKETPILENSTKKGIYQIVDPLFRFWHRFIPANLAAIASGRIELTYAKAIEPYLPEYMRLIFERMCKDYLVFHCKHLPVDVGEIGQWWGNNPNLKQQAQIDIVLTDPDHQSALFGECKFRNEPVDLDVLVQLKTNASLLPQLPLKHYVLFSKAGFTDRLVRQAKTDRVLLVSLADMYG